MRQPSLALCALILAPTILSAQAALPPPTAADLNEDGSFRFSCDSPDHCFYLPPGEQPTRAPSAVSNHLENFNFDASSTTGQLRAWNFFWGIYNPQNSALWSTLDSANDPNSGSVRVANATNTGAEVYVGIRQCVVGVPASLVDLNGGYVYLPANQPLLDEDPNLLSAAAYYFVDFFSSPDCANGTNVGGGHGWGLAIRASTVGSWRSIFAGTDTPPAGARSLQFRALVSRGTTSGATIAPSVAYFDRPRLSSSGDWTPAKGDIDRDGETDLVLRNNTTGDNYVWFMKDENRDSGPTIVTPSQASTAWQIAAVDTFAGPGASRDDFLMWNSATGATEFWLMNGTSRVGSPVPLAGAPPLPWKPSAAADLNRDGHADIIWRNYSTQKIEVWTMNGTTPVAHVTPSPDQAVDGNWEIVGATDSPALGAEMLYWYNWSSGKIVYWMMGYSTDAFICDQYGLAAPCYYRAGGNFTDPPNAGDANWKVLAIGDYGYGPSNSGCCSTVNTPDLIWRNATSGRMVLWSMWDGTRTGGSFITPDPPAPATDWTIAGPR